MKNVAVSDFRYDVYADFGGDKIGTVGRNQLADYIGIESDDVEILMDHKGFIRYRGAVYSLGDGTDDI